MVLKKTSGALPETYRAPSNLSLNSTTLTCKHLALNQPHCASGRCTFGGGVMSWFIPLTPHVLPKPHLYPRRLSPFLNLLDQPPTHLGHLPTSYSLSWTLVCFLFSSLPDTLDPPCLHFNPRPSILTSVTCPRFQTPSLTSYIVADMVGTCK